MSIRSETGRPGRERDLAKKHDLPRHDIGFAPRTEENDPAATRDRAVRGHIAREAERHWIPSGGPGNVTAARALAMWQSCVEPRGCYRCHRRRTSLPRAIPLVEKK